MKIFFRTVVWRLLVISSAITVGFAINAEFVGWKSTATERFFNEKLFSIEYNAQVESFCKTLGRKKLIAELGNPPPSNLQIIKEEITEQSKYTALFKLTTPDGQQVVALYQAKVKWKPSDYDYSEPKDLGLEKLKQGEPTLAPPKSKTIEVPPPAEEDLHRGALIT